MKEDARLYEPAEPLWHIGNGRMLFAGCLHRNALHSHSAPVLLAGLYDDFELKIGDAAWFFCRMAVIRAGTAYEFNSAGRPLAVVYVEPNVASVEGLAALVGETREVPGALIGMRGELSMIRALYEDPDSPRWVGSAIDDLVDFSRGRSRRHMDRRIARALWHENDGVEFHAVAHRNHYGATNVVESFVCWFKFRWGFVLRKCGLTDQ